MFLKPAKLLSIILLFLLITFSISFAEKREFTVDWGDTLFSLLSDSYSPDEILGIDKEIKKVYPDFTLRKGTRVENEGGNFTFILSRYEELVINKDQEKAFDVELKSYPVYTVNAIVTGEIQTSLMDAMIDQGEDYTLAYLAADILEWEIDFFKDLRKGDKFKILVEKRFIRGEFAGYGRIHAIDFINQGQLVRALFYEDEKNRGYFTPEGNSLKKGFLKAPLNFRRISSGYTSSRLHPVLKRYRPHYGIDYAAPTGTPVQTTADGTVIKITRDKAAGNYVKISHKNGYETFYMHLSAFKRGLRVGKYVKQGDIIGYVGATGYATGPHLDYRIKRNNQYLNPLKFKAPTVKLAASLIEDFRKSTSANAMKLDETYLRYTEKAVPLM